MEKERDFYITFGTEHSHNINGKKLTYNSLGVIKAVSRVDAYKKADDMFEGNFSYVYDSTYWTENQMSMFRGGLIRVD